MLRGSCGRGGGAAVGTVPFRRMRPVNLRGLPEFGASCGGDQQVSYRPPPPWSVAAAFGVAQILLSSALTRFSIRSTSQVMLAVN